MQKRAPAAKRNPAHAHDRFHGKLHSHIPSAVGIRHSAHKMLLLDRNATSYMLIRDAGLSKPDLESWDADEGARRVVCAFIRPSKLWSPVFPPPSEHAHETMRPVGQWVNPSTAMGAEWMWAYADAVWVRVSILSVVQRPHGRQTGVAVLSLKRERAHAWADDLHRRYMIRRSAAVARRTHERKARERERRQRADVAKQKAREAAHVWQMGQQRKRAAAAEEARQRARAVMSAAEADAWDRVAELTADDVIKVGGIPHHVVPVPQHAENSQNE